MMQSLSFRRDDQAKIIFFEWEESFLKLDAIEVSSRAAENYELKI